MRVPVPDCRRLASAHGFKQHNIALMARQHHADVCACSRLRKARQCAQARAAQTFLERSQQQVKSEQDAASPSAPVPSGADGASAAAAPAKPASNGVAPSEAIETTADDEAGSPTGFRHKPEEPIAATEPEEAERIHAQFMSMLLQAIEQSLDTSQFEDSCRALLGESPRHMLQWQWVNDHYWSSCNGAPADVPSGLGC